MIYLIYIYLTHTQSQCLVNVCGDVVLAVYNTDQPKTLAVTGSPRKLPPPPPQTPSVAVLSPTTEQLVKQYGRQLDG